MPDCSRKDTQTLKMAAQVTSQMLTGIQAASAPRQARTNVQQAVCFRSYAPLVRPLTHHSQLKWTCDASVHVFVYNDGHCGCRPLKWHPADRRFAATQCQLSLNRCNDAAAKQDWGCSQQKRPQEATTQRCHSEGLVLALILMTGSIFSRSLRRTLTSLHALPCSSP